MLFFDFTSPVHFLLYRLEWAKSIMKETENQSGPSPIKENENI